MLLGGSAPIGRVGGGTAIGGVVTVFVGALGRTAEAAGFGVSMSEPFSASKSGLLSRNVPVFPSSVAFHISSGVLMPTVSLPVFLSARVNVMSTFGFSKPCAAAAVAPAQRTARRFASVFTSDSAAAWLTVPSPFASFHFLSLSRSNASAGWPARVISKLATSSLFNS